MAIVQSLINLSISLILLLCGGAAVIAGIVALVYFYTQREDSGE
jgi:hypothetical protein